MKSNQRVAVIGECLVELSSHQDVLTRSSGGDTLNTASYLSRLTKQQGVVTSFYTGLDYDPFSRDMLAHWFEERLNLQGLY